MQIEVAFLDRVTNFIYDLTLYDNNELHTYRSVRINPNMNEWRSMTNLGGIVIPKVDSHSENQRVIKIIQSCQNLEEMTPFSFSTITDPYLNSHLFGSIDQESYHHKKKHRQSNNYEYSDNLSPVKNPSTIQNNNNHRHSEKNYDQMPWKLKQKLRMLHEADVLLEKEKEINKYDNQQRQRSISPCSMEMNPNYVKNNNNQDITSRNQENNGRIVLKISRNAMSVTQSTENSNQSSTVHEFNNASPPLTQSPSNHLDDKIARKAKKKLKKEKKKKLAQQQLQQLQMHLQQNESDSKLQTNQNIELTYSPSKTVQHPHENKSPDEIIAPVIERNPNLEGNHLISPFPFDCFDDSDGKAQIDEGSPLVDNFDNDSNYSYQSNFNINVVSSQPHRNPNEAGSSLASLSSNASSNKAKSNSKTLRTSDETLNKNKNLIKSISEKPNLISPLPNSFKEKESMLSSNESSTEEDPRPASLSQNAVNNSESISDKDQELLDLNESLSNLVCSRDLLKEFIKIICTGMNDAIKPIRDNNNLLKLLTFDLKLMPEATIQLLKEFVLREKTLKDKAAISRTSNVPSRQKKELKLPNHQRIQQQRNQQGNTNRMQSYQDNRKSNQILKPFNLDVGRDKDKSKKKFPPTKSSKPVGNLSKPGNNLDSELSSISDTSSSDTN